VTETQTVDLAAWLTSIWDEEERLAKEALAPDWRGSKTFYDTEGAQQDSWGLWLFHIYPASVLARIAADRKILELHSAEPNPLLSRKTLSWAERGKLPLVCSECSGAWPCRTLLLLASPYADRPGFREEWR
jgi:hypothetical protein